MSLKIPYDSTLMFLNNLITSLLDDCTLRLYSNNHVPANTDDVTDYTEATFPGYAAIPILSWPAASLDGSNKASTELAMQVWTAGVIITPQDIYGVFVTWDGDGSLVYAELDAAGPVSIASTGQSYGYLPRVTFKSEF